MDALRQALADKEYELATCLARRRILAVEREKLQLQIALCEKVCGCRETRLQIKQLIQQEEEAEAAAEQTERTALSKECEEDGSSTAGSAESLAPVRQAAQLLESLQSSNSDDNKTAASVATAKQTKRLMMESSDDEDGCDYSAAKADTLPYGSDDDHTEAGSDRGDGWSTLNTANREYTFITYDPWFVHHAKGEIILGVKSERKDVDKAQCDQIARKIDDFLSEHSGRALDMRERHLKAAILAGEKRMKIYLELKAQLKREPTDAERQLAGAYAEAYYPQDGKGDVPLGTGKVLQEQGSGNRDCVTHAYLNLLPSASSKKSGYRRRLVRSLHTASLSSFCHEDAKDYWYVDADGVVWQPRLLKSASFNDIARRRVRGDLLVACDGHCVAVRKNKILNAGSKREMPLTRANLISVGIKGGYHIEVASLYRAVQRTERARGAAVLVRDM